VRSGKRNNGAASSKYRGWPWDPITINRLTRERWCAKIEDHVAAKPRAMTGRRIVHLALTGSVMAETDHLHDWLPPGDEDWRRLRALLRAAMIRCRPPADAWDEAQRDVRPMVGENSSIGLGRYAARAHMERELADMLEDELRALTSGRSQARRLSGFPTSRNRWSSNPA
jgi:hypothetical protein